MDRPPETVAKELWPGDRDTVAVTRAVTNAATTTASGWASDLVVTAMSDLLVSGLGPASASGAVFARAQQLRFTENSVLLPGIAPSANNVNFVGENAVIPVIQFDLSGVSTLTRRKLSAIIPFTSEMLRSPQAEELARAVIIESLNLAIDKVLFDATPATNIRPAGLLAGVTATAAAGAGVDAKTSDLATLAGAVASVSGDHVFISDPATVGRVIYGPALQTEVPIFASSAVTAKQLICVGVGAMVVISGAPQLELASEGTLVMDTAAVAISTGGTIAANQDIRSLWQSDCVAVRLLCDINWGLRASGAVAWINSVNW